MSGTTRSTITCRGANSTTGRTIHSRTLNLRPGYGAGGLLNCRARLGSRARLGNRTSLGCRLVIDCWSSIYGRLVIHRRCVVHSRLGLMRRGMMHCGLRQMRRGMMHCRLRLIRRSTVHGRRVMRCTGSRHTPGMMPRRTMRRHAHTMHMVRVMPMPMIPGSRGPVRHQTGCRNSSNGENSHTGRGITIHGLAVIITINREAVHIISGICPRNSCTTGRPAHTDRGAGIHGVIIHYTGIQQQGSTCHQGNITQLRFHGFM